ncbi:Uncharacterised protein [Mycobacteroides abscessus subsp. abscessus]|nr:Uncharacterised protein [Mycobacteroides abscessus subsp. abscessus]
MKIFEPVMTYSSPSRTALVLMFCRSEPVPGSVMPMESTISPLAALGNTRRLSSSEPNSAR